MSAVSYFDYGKVLFTPTANGMTRVKINVCNGWLGDGARGFHIHESRDMSDGCKSRVWGGAAAQAVLMQRLFGGGASSSTHGEGGDATRTTTVDLIMSTHRGWLGTGGEPI